jgi:hypothetical protein
LDQTFVHKFRNSAIKFFSKFINQQRDDIILELLSYSGTWDFYKTALHYLDIYYDVQMNDPSFLILLLMMIHPDPTFRPSKIEMQTLLEIYKNNYVSSAVVPVKRFSKRLSKELRKVSIRKV